MTGLLQAIKILETMDFQQMNRVHLSMEGSKCDQI